MNNTLNIMIVLNDMYGSNKSLTFVFDFNFSAALGVT